jgi:hypothetical protein
MLHWRAVLVVSPDEEVRQNLPGILRQCGFDPVLTASVAKGRSKLLRHRICIVFCEDQVADGNYREREEMAHATTLGEKESEMVGVASTLVHDCNRLVSSRVTLPISM